MAQIIILIVQFYKKKKKLFLCLKYKQTLFIIANITRYILYLVTVITIMNIYY